MEQRNEATSIENFIRSSSGLHELLESAADNIPEGEGALLLNKEVML